MNISAIFLALVISGLIASTSYSLLVLTSGEVKNRGLSEVQRFARVLAHWASVIIGSAFALGVAVITTSTLALIAFLVMIVLPSVLHKVGRFSHRKRVQNV